ncbi:MAG: hypothetical protein ACYDA9_01010 [Terriglobia bacterium]
MGIAATPSTENKFSAGAPSGAELAAGKGKIFGKNFSDYLAFQKVWLALTVIVGFARLGLSLAGQPDATVKWASMTVVGLAGMIYYGVAVHTSGFGSYKQLLPLVFFQTVLANLIVIGGIVLSMAGYSNIFAAPEFSPPFAQTPQMQWAHILGHVIGGMGIGSLIGWGVASLVMLITKAVVKRPARA